jgi:hypothetical protein
MDITRTATVNWSDPSAATPIVGLRSVRLPPFGAPFPRRKVTPVVRDAALRTVHAIYGEAAIAAQEKALAGTR